MNCNCYSYNRSEWDKKNVIIRHKFWDWEEKDYCIDYCIADTIRKLWKNWIFTLGCCCWHWRNDPSIVFTSIEDLLKAIPILEKIDDRYFEKSYWGRIIY